MIRRPREPKVQVGQIVLEHEYRKYFIHEYQGKGPFVILDDERKEIGKASSLAEAQDWIDAEQAGDHDQFVGPSG
jgi:hypothetical protein